PAPASAAAPAAALALGRSVLREGRLLVEVEQRDLLEARRARTAFPIRSPFPRGELRPRRPVPERGRRPRPRVRGPPRRGPPGGRRRTGRNRKRRGMAGGSRAELGPRTRLEPPFAAAPRARVE